MRRALTLAAVVLAAMPAAAQAQLSLKPCKHLQCGRIAVPLDRSGATPGSVSLYVERQRALRRRARGVTLLLAGGPGQPATGAYNDRSRNPYGEFRSLTPLNDVVAFDGRWTGRSGLLRCTDLEALSVRAYGPVPYQVDGDHLGDIEQLDFRHEPAVLDLVLP